MSNRYVVIVAVVLGLIAGKTGYEKASQAFARFDAMLTTSFSKLGEGIDQAIATAKSAEKTSDTIRKTVDELKERLARLESSSAATVAGKQSEIDNLVDLLDKEQARRMQAELDNEQLLQSSKVMSKPAQQVVTAGPKIVMHSGAGCLPCQQWKRDVMPLWKAKGWEVQIIDEITSERTWPWFEVYEGGKRYEVNGPLTQESLMRAKR